ncbi:c-type cytochrome biogenesis protein CcsB [Herbaspirillum sp. HC18]|nr:c-type cytochrome biogenesis protein CcsB [Herbaspirillum sp. HC18]
MGRQSLISSGQFRSVPSWWYWVVLFVACAGMLTLVEYFETPAMTGGAQFEDLFAFKLLGYGNLLLVGAAVLYVGHLWSASEVVGRCASGIAGFGAMASLLALTARWVETYLLQRPGHFAFSSLHEMVALFTTLTVIIYLVMERAYRTRSAGAFVMMIVFGAVMFQIWLAANEDALPGSHIRVLRSYWMHAHVLGSFIGYGAFAVAAAMGAAYLVRTREGRGGLRSLPAPERIDGLMHNAIMLGFPVFTLATILGAIWAYQAWGRYWAWDPKETWALLVCLIYASYFYFHYVNRWSGRRMAWWSIAGFATTVFCFLGVRVFLHDLHSDPVSAMQGSDPMTVMMIALLT